MQTVLAKRIPHVLACLIAPQNDELSASQGQKIKQQDVSSWLTGIQEVPLSLQYKMRNIDETEAAKKRLLADAAPECAPSPCMRLC